MNKLPAILMVLMAWVSARAADEISLAGKWRFALDRQDKGIVEQWQERKLPDSVHLPGSLPAQGIGDPITLDTKWTGGIVDRSYFTAPQFAEYRKPGNIKVPFWLQPDTYYSGVAWYQREIEIPADWQKQRTILSLERPHWETRVWVDNVAEGTNASLSTPHEYDLGRLTPGKHLLTIRVDNRAIVDLGENSHCVSDHTQGNWNGIVGQIQLRTRPLAAIEDVQVYPDVAAKKVRVRIVVTNATLAALQGKLTVSVKAGANAPALSVMPVTTNFSTGDKSYSMELEMPLGTEAKTWDEFSPALYKLAVALEGVARETKIKDQQQTQFGLRNFAVEGTQFTINGRKTFIRGTLECCIFPKTGHPPTELDEWKRVIKVAKSFGLNLLRFHSYCPPEAAFVAADELGMYLQVETCWANQSTTIGDGKPVDRWVYDETDRVLKAYGNHPSFVLMPYGNEPGGKNSAAYLAKYVEHYKARDPRRLWTSGSGWPQLPENQFHVTPDPRVQIWGAGLKSRINGLPPETETDYRDYIVKRNVPVISHEIGQWCVYPNFEEIPKYTGYLKPKNFEIFRDFLNEAGMGKLAKKFLLASGKLQTLCYKEDIESALRTPGMAGFELLDLHDFPGQGTALVGVLDPFWEEKGYVTAREYSRFCNSTVPLARLPKRIFTADEELTAGIEVAHFGPTPLSQAKVTWKLVDDHGKEISSGMLPVVDIPLGNAFSLGTINAPLTNVKAPAHAKLVVQISGESQPGDGGQAFENDWDVWIYPAIKSGVLPTDPDVLLTSNFDQVAEARLRNGGKVLLTLPSKNVRNYESAPVKLGFSSIFWNTAWTARQAPTTLGIVCDPKHAALAEFPTDDYENWHWWYLVHRAGALRLDVLPKGIEPIVRVIDDWTTARPLGLVVEGKVGSGKIVICGFELTGDKLDPVSAQLRSSLMTYMKSEKFRPALELQPAQIQALITTPVNHAKAALGLSVKAVSADSAQLGHDPENATDNDPMTIWHTSWEDDAPACPHELVIEFEHAQKVAGITALPRQDGNHNGWIKDYAIYSSMDGATWSGPLAKGTFAENAKLKTVNFPQPIDAKAIKLVALSGYVKGPWVSLAEFHAFGNATNGK